MDSKLQGVGGSAAGMSASGSALQRHYIDHIPATTESQALKEAHNKYHLLQGDYKTLHDKRLQDVSAPSLSLSVLLSVSLLLQLFLLSVAAQDPTECSRAGARLVQRDCAHTAAATQRARGSLCHTKAPKGARRLLRPQSQGIGVSSWKLQVASCKIQYASQQAS